MISLPLRTERLEVRSFREADLAAMHGAWSDPAVMRWLPSAPAESLAASRERLSRHIQRRDRDGWGLGAVVERSSGDVIGACGLFPLEDEQRSSGPKRSDRSRPGSARTEPLDPDDRATSVGSGPEIEVAYHLVRSTWGRGYATEATRAVVAAAFRELELKHVVALAFPDNGASIRVMEKLGMTYECRAKRYGIECVQYGVDAGTWAGLQALAS